MSGPRLTRREFEAERHNVLNGGDHDRLEADHLQVREDVERLAQMLRNFAETAEAAVAHHERPKTGMQVPFHGDFAHVPPSAVGRLRWWAREMRALLAEVDPK